MSITTTPTAPRPGRLLVEHDPGLGLGASLMPLDDVRVDRSVSVTAEITGIQLFPGRVRMVLDDGHGGSADVLLQSAVVVDAFRSVGRPPGVGVRVQVRGTVVRRIDMMPKAIDGRSIRVVA
jgi:hypothetical protein